MKLYDKLYADYQTIIKTKPIILNLTNSVTQDFMANALLAIGASPIMSEEKSEIKELVTIASCININIGTLNQSFSELALDAASIAKQLNKPLVLDPVGANATISRKNLALELAPYAAVIRGNASEIMALNEDGLTSSATGVDSANDTLDAKYCGQILANRYTSTVVISGKKDLIISNEHNYTNYFGDPLMTRITGMGCVLGAIIAAFLAINTNHAKASFLAIIFYTLCAEKALTLATTPAKFKVEFIDVLYSPDWKYIEQKLSQQTEKVEI
jgi:hydroxyethylthiazole kinase